MESIPLHGFQSDDESSIPFQLVQLTKEGSYDTSIPHRHNYYEVFVFEVGGGMHRIDFQAFSIKDKSVHFVSPGQVHNVTRMEDSKGFVILFSRDFYSINHQRLRQFPFLNNNSPAPILNLKEYEFSILIDLIEKIQSEKNAGDGLSKDLIQAYLNTFLIHCKRYFSKENKAQQLHNDSLTFRFKQLIEEHYLQAHNVKEYVYLLHCTEKQLLTATKREIGQSPKALIDERILLEAKRLVMHTNHSLQEIAFFLNYTDASHFTKFFKGKTGISPGQFRDKVEKYT